jgi:hypothetical protein
MKLEDIMDFWEKDSQIDHSSLDQEALKISKIHHKYYKIYIPEKLKLKKMQSDLKRLKRLKYDYYNNVLSREECQELNWEPLQRKILKTDIDRHIDGDDDVIDQTLKISIQDEKCAYLQDIINSLKTRSYNLRVAMDFIRFAGGS